MVPRSDAGCAKAHCGAARAVVGRRRMDRARVSHGSLLISGANLRSIRRERRSGLDLRYSWPRGMKNEAPLPRR